MNPNNHKPSPKKVRKKETLTPNLIPKTRNSLRQLLKSNRKPITLPPFLHNQERIAIQITKILHIRLHPPIIFIRFQQLVLEEEPRVEPTHVSVGDTATVEDVLGNQLRAGDGCAAFVDVGWLVPVVVRDLAEGDVGV
jgi:hypothetical protein